jgi:hypothetical protein
LYYQIIVGNWQHRGENRQPSVFWLRTNDEKSFDRNQETVPKRFKKEARGVNRKQHNISARKKIQRDTAKNERRAIKARRKDKVRG